MIRTEIELTGNIIILNNINWHKIHHNIYPPFLLPALLRIQLVRPVQPNQWEDQLQEEGRCDKIWLWTPERDIGTVNIFHIWKDNIPYCCAAKLMKNENGAPQQ